MHVDESHHMSFVHAGEPHELLAMLSQIRWRDREGTLKGAGHRLNVLINIRFDVRQSINGHQPEMQEPASGDAGSLESFLHNHVPESA